MCSQKCATYVPSTLLQNNLLPSWYWASAASWGHGPSQDPAQCLPKTLTLYYRLHCLTPTGISMSNLHEPTPQVAAKDIADPLHLHSMDTDLQIPLLCSLEIFFLLNGKMKFIKKIWYSNTKNLLCLTYTLPTKTTIIGNTEGSNTTVRSKENKILIA